MAKYAKLIDEKDNVATVVADCKARDEITVKFKGSQNKYKCNHDTPFGHKIAIKNIKTSEKIIKYGESIGAASQNIKVGDWVHTHNVKDDYKVLDKEGHPLQGQED